MTSDHFRQFLIPPQNAGFAGAQPASKAGSRFASLDAPKVKLHLVWALVASGAAYASWQVSKWHSSYAKIQAKKTLVGNKKKKHSKS